MTKVWYCRDGDRPGVGDPAATPDFENCLRMLELRQEHFVCGLSTPPRIGEAHDPMADYRGYQHVIVEVAEQEARQHGWKPGFYRSPVLPQDAGKRLGI